MNVGFIGLGRMGTGMAQNLLRAGHRLTVYNRTRAKAEELASAGAQVAQTPADAARNCEAVFTMLADDAALTEVMWGEEGVLAGLSEGALHISSSTVSVAIAKRLAGEHGRRGQRFASGPVFGRPDAAEAKRLIVILAGKGDAVEQAKPLAEAIGRQTYMAGSEPWQANALKLGGNFMIASMLEAFGEAFALMRKAGVAEHVFLDTMVELFGSPVYKNYGTLAADRKFEPAAFALRLGLKDVKLALEAAGDLEAPMPIASVVRDQLLGALANGQGDQDWSALTMTAARAAGLKT